MTRRGCTFGVPLSLLILAPGFLRVQNGSISGTVQDPSGAAVPGAGLTLTALGTAVVTKTTSGPEGLYAFRNLLTSTHEGAAAAKGVCCLLK